MASKQKSLGITSRSEQRKGFQGKPRGSKAEKRAIAKARRARKK